MVAAEKHQAEILHGRLIAGQIKREVAGEVRALTQAGSITCPKQSRPMSCWHW